MGIQRDISELMTEIREKADIQNTEFVSDDELVRYINSAWRYANAKLTESYEDWNVSSYDFTTVSGTRDYALPADFVRLRKVFYVRDLGTSSEREFPLRRVNWQETDNYVRYDNKPNRFMLRGSNIRLFPLVNAAHDYRIYYSAAPATVTALSTNIDFQYGIDRFIIWDAVVACKIKDDLDAAEAMAERNMALQDMIGAAETRDASEPTYVQEVHYSSTSDWWKWQW